MKKLDLDSAVLGGGGRRFQVSSLRFFMCIPCLYGLKDSPGRLKKKKKKNTCKIPPAGHSLNLNVRPDLPVCNVGSDAVV